MAELADRWIKKILSLLTGCVLGYLTVLSLFSSSAVELMNFSENENQESWGAYNYFLPDKWWLHVIVIACVILAAYVLCDRIGKSDRTSDRVLFRWKMGSYLLFGLSGLAWILLTRMHPVSDPAEILNIAEQMVQGNYEQFRTNEGYLWRYPDQMGIVFFFYLFVLLFGRNAYIFIQILNLAGALSIIHFSGKIAELIWKEEKQYIGTAVCWCLVLFSPLLLYTTFVYGTIMGLAFSVAAIYMELQYFHGRKGRYIIFSSIAMGLAYVWKTNSLIILIAVILFLGYDFLMERKKMNILFLLLLLVVQMLFTGCIHSFMSYKSGYEVSKGMPKLAWVAMGLQESSFAPGTWNGFSVSLYEESDYDYDLTNERAMDSVRKSFIKFMEDKSEAVRWLGRKLAAEWNDPTFGAILVNGGRDGNPQMPLFINSIINGRTGYVLRGYLNYFQSILLFGGLLYFVLTGSKQSRENLIMGIALVGGFVFHVFWEAKSQYVLPYFLLVIPYSVKGYDLLIKKISDFSACRKNKEKLSAVKTMRIAALITIIIIGMVLLYPTRLFQYMVAVQDTPEKCAMYEERVEENCKESRG